ncbi:g906 [Coccomyxa elongata]
MSARRAAFEKIESALGDSVRRVGGSGGADLGFRPDPGADLWIPLKVQIPWVMRKTGREIQTEEFCHADAVYGPLSAQNLLPIQIKTSSVTTKTGGYRFTLNHRPDIRASSSSAHSCGHSPEWGKDSRQARE